MAFFWVVITGRSKLEALRSQDDAANIRVELKVEGTCARMQRFGTKRFKLQKAEVGFQRIRWALSLWLQRTTRNKSKAHFATRRNRGIACGW